MMHGNSKHKIHEKTFVIGRRSTTSQYVENLIWKRLWICCKTDCKTNETVMEVSAEKAKLLVTNASVFHNFTVNENTN